MTDPIEREAAIAAVREHQSAITGAIGNGASLLDAIRALPSARAFDATIADVVVHIGADYNPMQVARVVADAILARGIAASDDLSVPCDEHVYDWNSGHLDPPTWTGTERRVADLSMVMRVNRAPWGKDIIVVARGPERALHADTRKK